MTSCRFFCCLTGMLYQSELYARSPRPNNRAPITEQMQQQGRKLIIASGNIASEKKNFALSSAYAWKFIRLTTVNCTLQGQQTLTKSHRKRQSDRKLMPNMITLNTTVCLECTEQKYEMNKFKSYCRHAIRTVFLLDNVGLEFDDSHDHRRQERRLRNARFATNFVLEKCCQIQERSTNPLGNNAIENRGAQHGVYLSEIIQRESNSADSMINQLR